jgi:hypothetical protein
VLADHQGKVQKIYGGPEAGFTDGQGARFNAPLGVSFGENVLYVADTGNHALRRIDLRTHEVSTLAGNGQQGLRDDRTGTPVPDARGVASPWDVLYSEGMLYIAMSGTQQIWRMDVTSGKLAPFAGNGREELVDGPLLKAAFSQPSGLSLFGHWLYVADAESSAVRRIDLRQGGKVETLVGAGLFDFGDRDGVFPAARLQHVLGVVALGDTEVLVADTYNHKLKRLDLGGRSVTTLAGDGKPGKSRDGVLQMNEPGGLARYGNLVYIADTNNDRILRYDLERGSLEDWVVKP